MGFYSMSISSVLALPKRTFFWMLRQAERLEADSNRRQLQLLLAVQSAEGVDKAFEMLNEDVGTVYEWGKYIPPAFDVNDEGLDPEFDRSGLRALKAKHGA